LRHNFADLAGIPTFGFGQNLAPQVLQLLPVQTPEKLPLSCCENALTGSVIGVIFRRVCRWLGSFFEVGLPQSYSQLASCATSSGNI
jgi:hypothetical protein